MSKEEPMIASLLSARSDFISIDVLTPCGAKIALSYVNANESVSNIKQLLTEHIETATCTSYYLTIQDEDDSGSPLNHILNDFAEIRSYISGPKANLSIVLEDYNVKKVRTHLKRVREVLQSPPASFYSSTPNSNNNDGNTKPSGSTSGAKPVGVSNSSGAHKGKVSGDQKNRGQEEEKGVSLADDSHNQKKKIRDLLPSIDSLTTSASSGDAARFSLGNFYKEVLFRTGSDTSVSQLKTTKQPIDVLKSLAVSGWSPPPPERKLQGDLAYIEASSEEGTIYIVAIPSGFYVSKCSRHHFDPTPNANSHFSHDLLKTLLSAMPSLRNAWNASTSSPAVVEPGVLDTFATLYAQRRGESISMQPQWNVAPSDLMAINDHSRLPSHTYDVSRAQDDLADNFAVEERGVQREWNDEIQAIRELSCSDLNDKIMKSRLIYKVITEFVDACKTFVQAVADGHIAPLNVTDLEINYVYVYNGIFLSRAVDNKETFKLCKGEVATRKAAAHDLHNQRVLQSIGADGISTVLCCIVDFKGERYVGQTIIPGILSNSQNSARLLYGILEPGKRLSVKTKAHELFSAFYSKLFIQEQLVPAHPLLGSAKPLEKPETDDAADAADAAEAKAPVGIIGKLDADPGTPIRVDTEDELSPLDSDVIPHVGPIEGKLLEGSDGRIYALELLRLTPRDANYVASDRGTGNIPAELLSNVDGDICAAYLLRHELISSYIDHQVVAMRQNFLVEAAQRHKEAADKKKESAAETSSSVDEAKTADLAKKDSETSAEEIPSEENEYSGITPEEVEQCTAIDRSKVKLEINPNVFFDLSDPSSAASDSAASSRLVAGEETARLLANYLWHLLLPGFTKQIRQGEVAPHDCESMIQILHKVGINVRYLGQLANLAKEQENEDFLNRLEGKQRIQMMPKYWLEFLEIEMLARSVKHIVGHLLRSDVVVTKSPAATIAAVLNHIFGTAASDVDELTKKLESLDAGRESQEVSKSNKSKSKKNKSVQTKAADPNPAAVSASAAAAVPVGEIPHAAASRSDFLNDLMETLVSKFCYHPILLTVQRLSFPVSPANELEKSGHASDEGSNSSNSNRSNDAANAAYNMSNCRSLLGPRLNKATLLRRICQQLGLRIVTKSYNFDSVAPFSVQDIAGMFPRVKTCEPDNLLSEATEYLDKAKEYFQDRNIALAFELAQEASTITQQIVGPLHKETLRALELITNTLLSAGDYPSAIGLLVKSLTLSVQLCGLDNPDALAYHSHLSILFAETKNFAAAVQHSLTALYLAHLLGSDSHPEYSSALIQLATICNAVAQDNVTPAANGTTGTATTDSASSICNALSEYALQLLQLSRFRQTDVFKQSLIGETLAEIHMRLGNLDEALVEQRQCHKIISDIAGDGTLKAKSAKDRLEKYLRAVTQRNVTLAKERLASEELRKDREWLEGTAAAPSLASGSGSSAGGGSSSSSGGNRKSSGGKKKHGRK